MRDTNIFEFIDRHVEYLTMNNLKLTFALSRLPLAAPAVLRTMLT